MPANPRKSHVLQDGANVVRGVFIGGANVIPGVSGGTLALILGIYERLITAVSRFDLTLLGHLRHRRWKQALAHIDFRFLATLGIGIVVGVLATLKAINVLLSDDYSRSLTFAAFLGMIIASGILVVRTIKVRSRREILPLVLCVAAGIAAAASLSVFSGQSGTVAEPNYAYLFLCGALAMCATILPGVSGAMVLWMLGVYASLSAIPDQLRSGQNVGPGLMSIAALAAGCGVSLILFSKLLRWLLSHYHAATMAGLCGFMFGALPSLWPFQVRTGASEQLRPFLPGAFDTSLLTVIGVTLAAMLIVFVLHRFGHSEGRGTISSDNPATCEKAMP